MIRRVLLDVLIFLTDSFAVIFLSIIRLEEFFLLDCFTLTLFVFFMQKGDLKRSEEYYERAILADPHDGEVLSQYAKLQWDVHKDQDRAEMYYDQAVQAAPDDWLVNTCFYLFYSF